MKKGKFISFEGGDSCGKSTQIEMLKKYISNLENKDDFVFVREPGGTKIGEKIREILLSPEENMHPLTELLLFCSARIEDVNKVILPAISQGKIVIADRFYDSTIAYQGFARKVLPPEEILKLTKLTIGDVRPDKTIYLRLDPEECRKRKQKSGQELDRLEKEGLSFQEQVMKGYEFMISREKERFCVIDASKSREEIFEEILNILKILKLKKGD